MTGDPPRGATDTAALDLGNKHDDDTSSGTHLHDAVGIAVCCEELFSDDAVSQVHEAARGKPRTVNNLAIAALIASYVTGKKIADQTAARAAISEVISTE